MMRLNPREVDSLSHGIDRRHFLGCTALTLLGCTRPDDISGDFTGIHHGRGHLLQAARAGSEPSVTHQTDVLIVGGGVAGLAAARALHLKGVSDFALLELEDTCGGNSRSGMVGAMACPQGAHYLPLPGADAWEVQDLLEELGLRRRVAGRWVIDERHLCHSPQERLFFNGAWQEGLLPLHGVDAATLTQYRQFAILVEQARARERWTIPVSKSPVTPLKQALAAITFESYLNQHGLHDEHLRWYLNYCCCDDYGAGLASVSAWAGIHYFASRHGFSVPGMDFPERDGLLTWPQGNAWLTQRLAAPLADRLHNGQVVLRIVEVKHGVEVEAFNTSKQRLERWQARRAIVALPIFVAARVLQNPPEFLRQAAARTTYAPWLVANIHIKTALHDRPGAAPSWDNVLYGDAQGAPGLGYVDAMHQNLQRVPGATVLTYYRALGDAPGGPNAARQLLLNQPWATWRDAILRELAQAHPDLPGKTTRIDITRYGHAMVLPVPGDLYKNVLHSPSNKHNKLQNSEQFKIQNGRLTFAHSDWAGYSVFEEAFTLGHHAA